MGLKSTPLPTDVGLQEDGREGTATHYQLAHIPWAQSVLGTQIPGRYNPKSVFLLLKI